VGPGFPVLTLVRVVRSASIETAEHYRLTHVRARNDVIAIQIRDGSRQLENPYASARGESQALYRDLENVAPSRVGTTPAVHLRVGEAGIAHTLAG